MTNSESNGSTNSDVGYRRGLAAHCRLLQSRLTQMFIVNTYRWTACSRKFQCTGSSLTWVV